MTDNSSAGAYIKHKDYLLVQVPEGAKHIHVNMYDNDLVYSIMEGWRGIDLHHGTWKLIGLAAELTEGQKKEIVRRNDFREIDDHDMFEWFLKSHNLSENQTVILKLIEA